MANNFYERKPKIEEVCTRVDLSAKMQSATSFGSHELLSFEGKKREFGGPICTRQMIDVTMYSDLLFRVSFYAISNFPSNLAAYNNLHQQHKI